MSVSCEQFTGFTLTLKKNLTHADFKFFNDFLEKHPEYSVSKKHGQVALVVDGMNGEYARLILVENHINMEECVEPDEDYCKLNDMAPDYDTYSAIAQVYEQMYGTDFGFVNINRIEHAMWFHYS